MGRGLGNIRGAANANLGLRGEARLCEFVHLGQAGKEERVVVTSRSGLSRSIDLHCAAFALLARFGWAREARLALGLRVTVA